MRMSPEDLRRLPFRFERDGVAVEDIISGRVDPDDEPSPPPVIPVSATPKFDRSDELVDCLLEITAGMEPA